MRNTLSQRAAEAAATLNDDFHGALRPMRSVLIGMTAKTGPGRGAFMRTTG